MTASTTAICAFCGRRFERGRYQNRFRRAETRLNETARYCSGRCRTAASRAQRRAVTRDGSAGAPNGVGQCGSRIVPDPVWPGMYRIVLHDGSLSDMVNIARAKDAVSASGSHSKRGSP